MNSVVASLRSVDLNCDMGEGFGAYQSGADEALLRYVTSASIACGFHAGDPRTMDRTVAAAMAAGAVVGAHVSYPDLVGFGRRHMRLSREELVTDVLYQVGSLEAFCRRHGTSVRFLKAHGALYNDLAEDEDLAGALAEAVVGYSRGGTPLKVLALSGSTSVKVLEQAGVEVVQEAFADRAYTPDGRLVPRSKPGAVIVDAACVAQRGRRLALGEPIEDNAGQPLSVEAGSICVHGDTPGALELTKALREELERAGIEVRAFAAR